MTCNRCLTWRFRVQGFLRGLIAAANEQSTLAKIEMTLSRQDIQYEEIRTAINRLDKATATWLEELQADVDVHRDKVSGQIKVLRELNKNCKEMIRKQDDRIVGLENDIAHLTSAVNAIEFPNPAKIDYRIPGLKDG